MSAAGIVPRPSVPGLWLFRVQLWISLAALVGFKATGFLLWPWSQVLAPVWAPFVLYLAVMLSLRVEAVGFFLLAASAVWTGLWLWGVAP